MVNREDPVLTITSLDELFKDFGVSSLTEPVDDVTLAARVTHILKLCNALWIHSGDSRDPHVALTPDKNGVSKCSNGYVDAPRMLRYTGISKALAYQLFRFLMAKLDELKFDGEVDWIVGSDHSAVTFSHDVATLTECQYDFTEKGPDGTQRWERCTVKPEETVLQVEDTITTTKTVMAVREGMRTGNRYPITFAPVIGTLVHRSDIYEIGGAPIVYLVHYDIKTWAKVDCPLCSADSERISEPKLHQNWRKLTGREE